MEEIIESPAVDSKEIEIQTIHPTANSVIFIFSFLSYFFLFLYIVRGNFGISGSIATIILLIAAVAASYFTSRFFSLNNTTLRIEQNNIEIYSESNFITGFNNILIPLDDIKGYEFHDNTFYKQLVFYRIIGRPIVLTLLEKQFLQTDVFLNPFLPVINKKNRLSDQSFTTAFSKTAITLLITFIFQVLTIVLFEFYSLEKYQHPLVLNSNIVWSFFFINLFILFIFSKLFDRHKLRMKGKVACYVFIVMNFIILNAVSSFVIKAGYQLKKLDRPEEIFKYRTDRTFLIGSEIQVDTSIIGYHYEIASAGRRSVYNNFTQYFVSPVSSFQKDWYRLWIGQKYKHEIRKSESGASSKRIRDRFKDNKRQEFQKSFQLKPRFYEVVYSDFNQSFRQKEFFSSAISSYKSVIPLIVLEPHFEPYEEYKKDMKVKAAIFVLIILASIAISSSIAAYHR